MILDSAVICMQNLIQVLGFTAIQSKANSDCSAPTETFEHMKRSGDYYVTVVEDTNLGQIVATATLVIEHKFTHSCAKVCSLSAAVVRKKMLSPEYVYVIFMVLLEVPSAESVIKAF